MMTRVDGIKTKDPSTILTFNLIENKYYTVDLSIWEIVAFITITEDNIEVLDNVANELLKKKIDKDLTGKT